MNTLFGTDGIRGRVGTGWFTPERLIQLGNALALWAIQRYGKNAHILMLHDTRESCSWIKQTLQHVLTYHNIRICDAHVLPTPAAWHLMQQQPLFDCALVISASHNPYFDNGIKIIDRISGKLSRQDEECIVHLLDQPIPTPVPSSSHVSTYTEAEDSYCSAIMTQLSIQLTGKVIVLDTAHGATYRVAEKIFSAYGAHVIMLNNSPNGSNINDRCGSTDLAQLQQTVITSGAALGFAFDGDGDRVVAVNREGIVKDGDDLLALLLTHPHYQATTTVVGTVMSNQGFEQYLRHHNKQLIRTAVGDKHVAERLLQDDLPLGGEPSGHIIMRDLLGTGDGIFVALRTLEAIIATNNWSMTTFTKYPQIIINVPTTHRKDLTHAPLRDLITEAQQQLGDGRVIVRFSGTESCLRVMVEASTAEQAQLVGNQLAHHLAQELAV